MADGRQVSEQDLLLALGWDKNDHVRLKEFLTNTKPVHKCYKVFANSINPSPEGPDGDKVIDDSTRALQTHRSEAWFNDPEPTDDEETHYIRFITGLITLLRSPNQLWAEVPLGRIGKICKICLLILRYIRSQPKIQSILMEDTPQSNLHSQMDIVSEESNKEDEDDGARESTKKWAKHKYANPIWNTAFYPHTLENGELVIVTETGIIPRNAGDALPANESTLSAESTSEDSDSQSEDSDSQSEDSDSQSEDSDSQSEDSDSQSDDHVPDIHQLAFAIAHGQRATQELQMVIDANAVVQEACNSMKTIITKLEAAVQTLDFSSVRGYIKQLNYGLSTIQGNNVVIDRADRWLTKEMRESLEDHPEWGMLFSDTESQVRNDGIVDYTTAVEDILSDAGRINVEAIKRLIPVQSTFERRMQLMPHQTAADDDEIKMET